MYIQPEKWQHHYTGIQTRWKDVRETFQIMFPLIAGTLLATFFGILFIAASPERFSFGTSSLFVFSAIILTTVLPLILGIAGFTLIFRSATTYFRALYVPPENTNVGKLIRLRLFGIPPLPPPLNSLLHYPFVIANNGEIGERDGYAQWLGGPASLIVMDGTALYLERGNSFSRVIGPGIAFLEKYERIGDIVDLRPQTYTGKVESWTKDGIKVEFHAKIICRIGVANGTVFVYDLNPIHGEEDQKNSGEDQPIFPCDPLCVRKAVERTTAKRRIKKEGEEELYESNWLDGAWGVVHGALANYISKHHLEELFVSSNPNAAGQILSGEERERVRDSLDQNLMRDMGTTLIDLQIENFTLQPLINEKRVEKWMAQWQAKADVRGATADAEWTRAVQSARAEAQRDLIIQIADGLGAANPETFENSVLLALSGILQESLGDPYAPTYLTEALEKIQELLK